MAIVKRFIAGFYVDGISEVWAVYNDVTNQLRELTVTGDSAREVDVTINGETAEIGKHSAREFRFDQSRRGIPFFIAEGEDPSNDIIPDIRCTFYAEKLSRKDINADKIAALSK